MISNTNYTLENCIALTGGIATGKSTVSAMLEEMGAHIIDTDLIAREIVKPGEEALNEIIKRFGNHYINSDGTLNRQMMRDEIIKNSDKRELLNRITHPRIMEQAIKMIEEYKNTDSLPIIVDVPLLFESGWDRWFTSIILVYIPVDLQINRLMKRDSISIDEARTTINTQMSIEEKKDISKYIIDNTGSLEKTREQVETILKSETELL